MGFAREDTRKLQEADLTTFTRTCKTYIYKCRFERHDRNGLRH